MLNMFNAFSGGGGGHTHAFMWGPTNPTLNTKTFNVNDPLLVIHSKRIYSFQKDTLLIGQLL